MDVGSAKKLHPTLFPYAAIRNVKSARELAPPFAGNRPVLHEPNPF